MPSRMRGFEVVAHSTFEGARKALHDDTFDALVTDVRLGAFNGLQLAVISRDAHPDIRVIVFSGLMIRCCGARRKGLALFTW